MITIIDDSNTNKLLDWCGNGPFGCKIKSLFKAYGCNTPFLDFWVQSNASKINSAMCKFDSSVCVLAGPNSDVDELSNFLKAIEVTSVSSNIQFPFDNHRSGHIIKHNGRSSGNSSNIVSINPKFDDIYSVLKSSENEKFVVPGFDALYVDIMHRIRKKCARSVGLYRDEKMVSCAMTVSETTGCAIIGAVATRPENRKSGNGTIVVSTLVNMLISEKKDVYILLNDERNLNFYHNMGFSICGNWNEYVLV